MHKRTAWPIHGRYLCKDCGREFLVEWDGPYTFTGTVVTLTRVPAESPQMPGRVPPRVVPVAAGYPATENS